MKKKITATVLTVGAAFALIAGNGIMTTYAATSEEAQQVEVIGQHQQPEIAGPGSVPGIQIKDVPVNEKVAVVNAEKAIQEKFKVSLSGMNITYTLSTRADREGTFYFVTFEDQTYNYSDEELLKAKRDLKEGKDIGIEMNDIYTAFVNAETGEIDSVEKNPTAPEGAN
ncbi:hypothetical protein [Paenibacillus arenilitoris]|uniref:Uncharacterized protein n=1 Tax=Paenibacillus arenilitoris TaxID=2772299 RepID=A0A927CV34_9BACL|nr:hypothetical protein [Paenibacillus arenilitoris]MBD2872381.1 hypothetical protein [Paenibacillus arenilitoris]